VRDFDHIGTGLRDQGGYRVSLSLRAMCSSGLMSEMTSVARSPAP
jgi:hypothetical protein